MAYSTHRGGAYLVLWLMVRGSSQDEKKTEARNKEREFTPTCAPQRERNLLFKNAP